MPSGRVGAAVESRRLTVFRWVRRRGFGAGIIAGCVLIFAGRLFINRTSLADHAVSPLLMDDTAGKADAIVVMGAGIINGCVPNNNGLRRVMLGTRLWRDGRAPILFFTGGSGPESCPVTVAMSQLARELGVPDAAMQVETASLNTHENGVRSAPMLDGLGARRLLIVTDRLHMRRAAGIFGRLGFEIERASVPIYEGHTDNVSMLYAGVREMAALGYYRTRGWLGPASQVRAIQTGPVKDATSAMSVKNPKGPLVILGASYASGWETPDLAGKQVVNKGIDGQQSFEMLERFDRDVIALSPSAVILWGFINDIHRSQGSMDETLRRARESYVRMIDLAKAQGIEPIVATEVSIRPVAGLKETLMDWVGSMLGKTSYQDQINKHVAATNAWLVDYARQQNLLVLDFNATLRDDSGRRRPEFAKPDGSHIPAAGYAALTAYSRPLLARHFGAAQSGS